MVLIFSLKTSQVLNSSQKLTIASHSNDSHQCPILAPDFVIYYYGIENVQAIQAGAGSE